jgi:hypothetical protein
MLELLDMYLPRRLKDISENSGQSGRFIYWLISIIKLADTMDSDSLTISLFPIYTKSSDFSVTFIEKLRGKPMKELLT